MKKLILILVFILITLPFVSAGSSIGSVKLNDCISLHQTCPNCTYVNLTSILNQNKSLVNIDATMTKVNFDYNLTYCNNSELGDYYYNACGDVNGIDTCENIHFKVTSTGRIFDTGQSLSTIGILFGSLFVSFLFLYIGFRTIENPKMAPIGFIFIVLSIILIIYSLFIGWAIGSDIIEHQAFSSTAETIFVSVLWLMVAVVLISFIFFIFAFIKELGDKNKIDKFGEGFNPITDTYDY